MAVKEHCLIWLCIFGVFRLIAGQQTTNCPEGVLVNGVCYTIVFTNSTWSMASDYCETHKGKLASVTSQEVQKQIEDLAKVTYSFRYIPSLWIGGYESVNTFKDRVWKWVSDDSVAGPQGCYNDMSTNPDLPFLPDQSTLRDPISCMDTCRMHKYRYAGVQYGGFCYCGNGTFGKHGTSGNCNELCKISNTFTNWCGGPSQNHIYDVTGGYSQWGYLQPNNHDSYQMCAVLDKTLSPYKFADEQCNKLYSYICEINGRSPCAGTDSNGAYYQGSETNKCYYITYDNSATRLNWFNAKQQCIAKGGNLVKIGGSITTSAAHSELKTILTSVWGSSSGVKLWIGLRKGGWSWKTNEPFAYTNWYMGEPNSAIQHCTMMNITRQWMWSDEICSSYSYFVCQGGDIPTTTSTTTSTTTTTVSTITTTVNATTSGTTPSAGAQTSGGLTNEEIVLLVVLLVMGIIGVIVFILLCIYCCKKKQRKVYDSKGSIHGESVTSRTTTSDYASKFIDINDQTDFFNGQGYHYRY